MDLESLLSENTDKPRDLVLGVQCLMRAFAPELAGTSLAQVDEHAGLFIVQAGC